MKTKSNLPKARVMWVYTSHSGPCEPFLMRSTKTPCPSDCPQDIAAAVIPCATRKEAAALVAKHNRRAAR